MGYQKGKTGVSESGVSERFGRLTDVVCRRIPPPEAGIVKLSDGGGLYLAVLPTGTKAWRLKYRFQGKERTISFGLYDEVSLAEARRRRDLARAQLRDNLDPVAVRRSQRTPVPPSPTTTFQAVAEEYLGTKSYSHHHAREVRRILKEDIGPDLGALDVAAIDTPLLLRTLRKIEARGHLETLGKARRLVSQVFRYAIRTGAGKVTSDPAAPLARDVLKTPDVRHRATIPTNELPGLLSALANVPCELSTRLACSWLMLTACRTSEMRFAIWSEIDGDVWRIPAARMKMKLDHVVPLSSQAHAVLAAAKGIRTSPESDALIFPGFTRYGPLSENAILALLARCGYYGRQTGHGFRASFSTWAHEVAEAEVDVIEACLAHVQGGVRGVYNRALYLPQRRVLLQRWGAQLEAWGLPLP